MPAVSGGYSVSDKALLVEADKEAVVFKNHSDRAWRYYRGDQDQPLKKSKSGEDHNIIVNKLAPHVDSTVGFAAPDFPQLNMDEDDQEQVAGKLWKDNRGAVFLQNAMTAGALDGHVFVRIVPDPVRVLRLVLMNAGKVVTFWAEDDVEQVLWYEVRYTGGGVDRRQHILAPGVDNNAQWQVREYTVSKTGGVLVPIGAAVDMPYRPIVDWQHLPRPMSYRGNDELQGMGIQDGINKTASDIKKILSLHASPRVVIMGDSGAGLKETGVAGMLAFPTDDVKVQVLDSTSDLASSMNYLAYLERAYMEVARVTHLTGGPDQYKGITNLGIKAAFKSQIEKTESIRRQYGYGIGVITVEMMRALGQEVGLPDVIWPSALPQSEAEQVQVVQGKRAMGVLSLQSAAKELGVDWQTEAPMLADEIGPEQALVGVV
jgi:hypothetical protein